MNISSSIHLRDNLTCWIVIVPVMCQRIIFVTEMRSVSNTWIFEALHYFVLYSFALNLSVWQFESCIAQLHRLLGNKDL